jgi:hypothetical protein
MKLKLQFSLRHRSNAIGTFFFKPTRSHFINIYQNYPRLHLIIPNSSLLHEQYLLGENSHYPDWTNWRHTIKSSPHTRCRSNKCTVNLATNFTISPTLQITPLSRHKTLLLHLIPLTVHPTLPIPILSNNASNTITVYAWLNRFTTFPTCKSQPYHFDKIFIARMYYTSFAS